MYAEEYLADDALEYFDVEDVSIDESTTIDTDTREQRKISELYKRTNKYYYTYKTNYYEGGQWKQHRIQLYSSPLAMPGYIRNASSGIVMPHRIGSKYEDIYFIMIDVSAHTKTAIYNEPRKLYYANPEECERHLKITVPREVKEKWLEKNMRARAGA